MSLDFGIIACELFQLRELRLHVRVHLNGKYVIRSESDSQEKIDIPIEFSRMILSLQEKANGMCGTTGVCWLTSLILGFVAWD